MYRKRYSEYSDKLFSFNGNYHNNIIDIKQRYTCARVMPGVDESTNEPLIIRVFFFLPYLYHIIYMYISDVRVRL